MNFKLVASNIDTAPLLAKIASLPVLWTMNTARQDWPSSPHRHTEVIHIRRPIGDTPEAMFNDLDSVDTGTAYRLSHELRPIMDKALAVIGDTGDLGRVMITKMPPKTWIDRHMDEGRYADHYDRFHLCVDVGQSFFNCGKDTKEMKPGELWWFNHKQEHSVANLLGERIHLIIDVQAPAYKALRGQYCQAELASDIWDEAMPLLKKHWAEIAKYQDIPLDPDREAYEQMENAGMLRCYTVRDAGVLIGYAVFMVKRNPHYKGSLQAVQDVLYIDREHRSGMKAGVRLIRMVEQRLRAEGVQVVYHHAKRINRLGEILRRLGYDLADEIFAKRLDKE